MNFRPHDWGAFFNYKKQLEKYDSNIDKIFVPMIGELFSIMIAMWEDLDAPTINFRPHDWGAFFNSYNTTVIRVDTKTRFSSP